VWSVADHASLKLKLRDGAFSEKLTLVLNMIGGFLSEGHKTQRILIRIGDREIGRAKFEYGVVPEPIEIKLPAQLTSEIVVDLSLPDAVSPEELNINEDARKLGVKLKSFVIRR